MQRKKIAMGILVVGLVTVIMISGVVGIDILKTYNSYNAGTCERDTSYSFGPRDAIASPVLAETCPLTISDGREQCINRCRSLYNNYQPAGEGSKLLVACANGCSNFSFLLQEQCIGKVIKAFNN